MRDRDLFSHSLHLVFIDTTSPFITHLGDVTVADASLIEASALKCQSPKRVRQPSGMLSVCENSCRK